MKKYDLNDMIKGWFVGNFSPSVLKTCGVEVGVKYYKAGDFEESHHHRKATEITVIVQGKVEMNGETYKSGDILVVEPFETTDFMAIEDTITTVVKYPSVENDKYLGEYKK